MTHPETPRPDASGGSRSPMHRALLGLLLTLRPKQWVKNAFVAAPLIFSQRLGDFDSLVTTAVAVALFCLVSGCVYVINDIVDVEKDRAHPKKSKRAIASGIVPLGWARNFVVIAMPLAAISAAFVSLGYMAALIGYFALNLAYCFVTKRMPYIDVMSIAAGFVLRVWAGALAIDVPPSGWLITCTALLSMFLGFGKRAHELATSPSPTAQRDVLAHYHAGALTWILRGLAIATTIAYIAYTQSEHSAETFANAELLIWSAPFPALGVLRFSALVNGDLEAESPTEAMLSDKPFLLNLGAWAVIILALFYI